MQSRQSLQIPLLKPYHTALSIADIALAMDNFPKHSIANAPWHNYPYKPECEFAITYTPGNIVLKFYVTEDVVLARFTQPNSLVYKDSCVEFFIAFDNDADYYNLEFNCLGTAYVGFGNGKTGREEAPVEVVKLIESNTILKSDDGKIKWQLTLKIPATVFYRHNTKTVLGGSARCNFYKCGDEMPIPHYLCWNNIASAEPNFHLSVFFGDVSFAGLY